MPKHYRLKAAPVVIQTEINSVALVKRTARDFYSRVVWNLRRLVGSRTR